MNKWDENHEAIVKLNLLHEIFYVPGTTFMAALIIVIFWFVRANSFSLENVGLSYRRGSSQEQVWRIITSNLTHLEFLHLLSSLLGIWVTRVIEISQGTLFYLSTSMLLLVGSSLLSLYIRYQLTQATMLAGSRAMSTMMRHLSCGYSPILLGLLVLSSCCSALPWPITLFNMFWLPMLVPNSDVFAHNSSVAIGYLIWFRYVDIPYSIFWSLFWFSIFVFTFLFSRRKYCSSNIHVQTNAAAAAAAPSETNYQASSLSDRIVLCWRSNFMEGNMISFLDQTLMRVVEIDLVNSSLPGNVVVVDRDLENGGEGLSEDERSPISVIDDYSSRLPLDLIYRAMDNVEDDDENDRPSNNSADQQEEDDDSENLLSSDERREGRRVPTSYSSTSIHYNNSNDLRYVYHFENNQWIQSVRRMGSCFIDQIGLGVGVVRGSFLRLMRSFHRSNRQRQEATSQPFDVAVGDFSSSRQMHYQNLLPLTSRFDRSSENFHRRGVTQTFSSSSSMISHESPDAAYLGGFQYDGLNTQHNSRFNGWFNESVSNVSSPNVSGAGVSSPNVSGASVSGGHVSMNEEEALEEAIKRSLEHDNSDNNASTTEDQ